MNDPNPKLAEAQGILTRIYKRQLYSCVGETGFRKEDSISRMSETDIAKRIVELAGKGRAVLESHVRNIQSPYKKARIMLGTPPLEDKDYDSDLAHYTMSRSQSQSQSERPQALTTRSVSFSKDIIPLSRKFDERELEKEVLTEDDIIVEKMHIHYGLKDQNPVSRLRFYPKTVRIGDVAIGREISESMYDEMIPDADIVLVYELIIIVIIVIPCTVITHLDKLHIMVC